MERWSQKRNGEGHKTTHMGTWVPAKAALSPKDVAGMNIVT